MTKRPETATVASASCSLFCFQKSSSIDFFIDPFNDAEAISVSSVSSTFSHFCTRLNFFFNPASNVNRHDVRILASQSRSSAVTALTLHGRETQCDHTVPVCAHWQHTCRQGRFRQSRALMSLKSQREDILVLKYTVERGIEPSTTG